MGHGEGCLLRQTLDLEKHTAATSSLIKSAKMPLPEDKEVVETAGALVETLKNIFSTPPGFRPGKDVRPQGTLFLSLTLDSSCQRHPVDGHLRAYLNS